MAVHVALTDIVQSFGSAELAQLSELGEAGPAFGLAADPSSFGTRRRCRFLLRLDIAIKARSSRVSSAVRDDVEWPSVGACIVNNHTSYDSRNDGSPRFRQLRRGHTSIM